MRLSDIRTHRTEGMPHLHYKVCLQEANRKLAIQTQGFAEILLPI